MSTRRTSNAALSSQSDAESSQSRSVALPTIMSGVASSFSSSNGIALDKGGMRRGYAKSFEDDGSSDSVSGDESTEYSLEALRRRLEKIKAADFMSSGSSTESAWIDVSDSSSSLDSSYDSFDDTAEKGMQAKFDDGNATAASLKSGVDEELTFSSSPTRLRQHRLQRQRNHIQSLVRSYDTSRDPEGRVCRGGDTIPSIDEATYKDDNVPIARPSIPSVRRKRTARRQPLDNVRYFPSVEVASTDRDLSTVEPIRAQDARPAFNKKLPRVVPAEVSDSDDVSSIGQSHYKTTAKIPRQVNKMDLIDEESGSGNTSRATRDMAKAPETQSVLRCTCGLGTETFFVLVISIAMTVLIILIAVLASRKG